MLRQRVTVGLVLIVAISLRGLGRSAGRAAASRPAQRGGAWGAARYAAATWQSLVAMTDPRIGPVVDHLRATGAHARYTSPTNITAWIWSTLAIRPLLAIEQFRTGR
jgi:hypothetical protein